MSRRRRRQRPGDVPDELDAVVDMLEKSSRDVFRLRVDMKQYDLLRERLLPYGGWEFIERWYVGDMLMTCRRLVDISGNDVVSIHQALRRLGHIADHVTAEEIAALRGRRPGAATRSYLASEIDDELRRWIPDHQDGDPIGRRVVQGDLDRIARVAGSVETLATSRVAHRLDKPADGVTRDDVEQLLERLQAIYVRWSKTLRGIDVMFMDPDALSPALLRALELFDWDDYVAAVDREVRRLGPDSGPFDDIEARARIEYRFDAPADRGD